MKEGGICVNGCRSIVDGGEYIVNSWVVISLHRGNIFMNRGELYRNRRET